MSTFGEEPPSRYKLIIRQNCTTGRACGFGNKVKRRTLDPPAVLQLAVWSERTQSYTTNLDEIGDIESLVASVSLISVDDFTDRSYVVNPHTLKRLPVPPAPPQASSLSPTTTINLIPTSSASASNSKNPSTSSLMSVSAASTASTSSSSSSSLSALNRSNLPLELASFTSSEQHAIRNNLVATLFGSLTESCLSALDYFPDKVSQNQQMRRTSKGDDNKHENHNDDDNFNKNDDDQALQGAFFIFSNVCTRLEGRFRLRFILNDLTSAIGGQHCLCSVISEPFTCYSVRDFPGIESSSLLIKHLFNQGINLPMRNIGRKESKRQSISNVTDTTTISTSNILGTEINIELNDSTNFDQDSVLVVNDRVRTRSSSSSSRSSSSSSNNGSRNFDNNYHHIHGHRRNVMDINQLLISSSSSLSIKRQRPENDVDDDDDANNRRGK